MAALIIKAIVRLVFLCILWVLTRSLQFVFELSDLTDEACSISNSELDLQIKIQLITAALIRWELTESPLA